MNTKTIVVADDDAAILDSVKMMLEFSDYRVKTTSDREVVKMVKENMPDLVLLDIWMSGVDGRDVCRKLKHLKETKDIPVILISASSNLDMSKKNAGADDCLAKPFDMEDLLQKVERNLH